MKKLVAVLAVASVIFSAAAQETQQAEKKLYNDGKIDYAPAGTQIQLAATDSETDVESIMFSLDGNEETAYNESEPLVLEEEGRHVIYYAAIDKMGNRETEKIYSIVIDNTPARLAASTTGPVYVNENGTSYCNAQTAFYLRAEDDLSGVEAIYASIEGVNDYEIVPEDGSAFSMAELQDGEYNLLAYSVDNVGNVSNITLAYTLDNTAPVITITPAEELLEKDGVQFTNKQNVFEITAADDLSGVKDIYVSIDGGEYTRYSEKLAFTVSGEHTIAVRAQDNLGNESQQELAFKIDTEAPETTLTPVIDEVK